MQHNKSEPSHMLTLHTRAASKEERSSLLEACRIGSCALLPHAYPIRAAPGLMKTLSFAYK